MSKIEINIKVKEMVSYDQWIEVSEEDYERLKELEAEGDVRDVNDVCFIEGLIDRNDVFDTGGVFEDLEIEKQ